MTNQKELHDQVVEADYNGMTVRFRHADRQVYISVMDARNLLQCKFTNYPTYSVCASYARVQFFKGTGYTSLTAVLPYDLENLCRGGERRPLTPDETKKIAWMREVCQQILGTDSTEETPGPQQDTAIVMQYNGCNISFLNGEDVMVNATEMANVFNKSPNHWLRNNSTKEFISTLAALRNRNPSDLVQVVNGDNGGTWVHQDVAIEMARWLSPAFAIWCNDRIMELMRHGVTATAGTLDRMLSDPETGIRMLTALKEERAAKELAIAERDRAQATVIRQQPKADYYDNVIEERSTYSTSQIAGELGMCYKTLRTKLVTHGILTSMTGPAQLTTGHEDWGETNNKSFNRYPAFKWTKKGRSAIFDLVAPGKPK